MTQRSIFRNSVLIGGVAVLVAIGVVAAQDDDSAARQWLSMGHDLSNSRNQPFESQISPDNVGTLVTKWTYTTGGGDVSATPTVADNAVYFPDWGGNLYAINMTDGRIIWSHHIIDYTQRVGSMSRVSPAVFNDLLIVGDNMMKSVAQNGAHMMAVDRKTGEDRKSVV